MNERHRYRLRGSAWLPLLAPSWLLACEIQIESEPDDSSAWFSEDVVSEPGLSDDRGWSNDPPVSAPPRASAPPSDPRAPAAGPYAPIEPSLPSELYRDLIVLDPELMNGPLAANGNAAAPWSFRAQMQWLGGAAREPFDFTRSWLVQWESASSIGPELAPVTPRPAARALLIDPWLSASAGVALAPSPAATPGYAPATGAPGAVTPALPPSWAQAPFRLIAIVNRVDLANDPCAGPAGELRYVYAAVEPMTGQPLDMTLILEVPYPSTRSAADWARAWSELGSLPAGAAYAARLAALTRDVQTEGDPLRVRLRSNEVALANPGAPSWELREFHVEIHAAQLELVQSSLEFTPRADVDPALLAEHVLEHADEIRSSGVSLPEALRAGAAEIATPDFSWPVLGVSEGLRQAFSLQTCNGCHGGDTAALPFRHIGAGASLESPARLSRFLYDPDADSDELRRRAERLEALVASVCEPRDDVPVYPGQ